MTLALAILNNNEVFLIADTQITPPLHKDELPFHELKVFFLDKFMAIAYAGTAGEVAHLRIRQIYQMNGVENICHLAEQINKIFDKQVDFLLAKAGPSPEIAKVSEGVVAISNASRIYWIGDSAAANFVTREMEDLTISGVCARFNEVIESPDFSTVGGHVIPAKGDEYGFRFVQHMKLVSPRYVPKVNWEAIDFGNAENGGFGYTTVVPKEIGINGWGVYYFQGKFGKYFRVDLEKDIGEILEVHANNVEHFVNVLETEIGIQLEYMGSLGQDCGQN